MPDDISVKFPAGYASGTAIAYVTESGGIMLVGDDNPLPVTTGATADPDILAGTTGQSTQVGPYAPVAGLPVVVQLSGAWTGTVTLLRSIDGGVTRVPVTAGGQSWAVFTGNVCEPVWVEQEADVELYLQVAITQGTLAYRVSQ